jgi:hypothetical protein
MESNFIPMVPTKHYHHNQPIPPSPLEQMISSLSAYSMLTEADWETGLRKRRKNHPQEERMKVSDLLAIRRGWREEADRQKMVDTYLWRVG